MAGQPMRTYVGGSVGDLGINKFARRLSQQTSTIHHQLQGFVNVL
jgi:hypothetical protein